MPDDESIVRLLSVLYAAPTETRRWGEFLQELCAMCHVTRAALIAHDLALDDHRILARQGHEIESAGHLYERYYWKFDKWTSDFCRASNGGRVILGEEIWTEKDLLKSIYYNDFLKKYDILQLLGIPYTQAPGVFESISLYRGMREDRFGPEQMSVLKKIAPHLRIALEIRHRLQSLENRISDLETALDSLQSALLLVDTTGAVTYLNRMARSLLTRSKELFVHKCALVARCPGETATIKATIEKAIATVKGEHSQECGVLSIKRHGKRALHVLVAPITSYDSALPGRRAAAVIFIDDPELQPAVPAEVLRTLFGLTPAEARLALTVLGGHTVSEAAELGRVSRETAKSQMSAILSKTGTRRQGELIRLLSRLHGRPSCGPGLKARPAGQK